MASKPKAKKTGKASSLTKNQLTGELATKTGLSKVQVDSVLTSMADVVKSELRSKGVITILPGLVKIAKVHKAARPARQGRNPSTGEAITIAPKKASEAIKVKPLKSLKEMI